MNNNIESLLNEVESYITTTPQEDKYLLIALARMVTALAMLEARVSELEGDK